MQWRAEQQFTQLPNRMFLELLDHRIAVPGTTSAF
jgi:hypothetical protein